MSSRSKIKALFKDYIAPICEGNATDSGEVASEKLLDDLFDYIIRSVGGLDIRYVREIAVKYISPSVGGKIMTIAEKLRTEGKAEKAHEVALNLLKKGISIDIVSETTGLSPKEIERLR